MRKREKDNTLTTPHFAMIKLRVISDEILSLDIFLPPFVVRCIITDLPRFYMALRRGP